MQRGSYERALTAVERISRAQSLEQDGRGLSEQERRVLRELSGSRCPVLAFEADDGFRLAVKIIQAEQGKLDACPVGFPEGAANVIPVLDVFAWAEGYGLVMPLAERSLRQWIRERDPAQGLGDLFGALQDVAVALASIDERMVHGDLKPENILLYAGHWCLADFGPCACRSYRDEHGEHLLTPAYAAPEQWRREAVTSRTDVYAFGILAFELLHGSRPFRGPAARDYRRQHLLLRPPSLPHAPRPLAALVAACLEKESRSRPTPAEIVACLSSNPCWTDGFRAPASMVRDPGNEDVPTLEMVS